MKKYLFILQQAPFSTALNHEVLELMITLASFEQQVSVLFINDGILQLANTQLEHRPGKDLRQTYAGLHLFDINDLYIDPSALEKHDLQLDQLHGNPKLVNLTEQQDLINNHNVIFRI